MVFDRSVLRMSRHHLFEESRCLTEVCFRGATLLCPAGVTIDNVAPQIGILTMQVVFNEQLIYMYMYVYTYMCACFCEISFNIIFWLPSSDEDLTWMSNFAANFFCKTAYKNLIFTLSCMYYKT